MESRKMVLVNLFAEQEQRCRCSKQTCAHKGKRRGWDELERVALIYVTAMSKRAS